MHVVGRSFSGEPLGVLERPEDGTGGEGREAAPRAFLAGGRESPWERWAPGPSLDLGGYLSDVYESISSSIDAIRALCEELESTH